MKRRNVAGNPSADVVLVLTCIDYRFIRPTVRYLARHNDNATDFFILAGASLGFLQSFGKDKPEDAAWANTFLAHVGLAKELHQITEIIVVDHTTCGYYESVYGTDDEDKLETHHKHNLREFMKLLRTIEPTLKVSALLASQGPVRVTFEEVFPE